MKPDQERVKGLLSDTLTLLCRNGLNFDNLLQIEGLLCITVDKKDTFVVHMTEKYGEDPDDKEEAPEQTSEQASDNESVSKQSSSRDSPSRKRRRKSEEDGKANVKQEPEDDEDDLVIIDSNRSADRRVPPLHQTSDYGGNFQQPKRRSLPHDRGGMGDGFSSGDNSMSSDNYGTGYVHNVHGNSGEVTMSDSHLADMMSQFPKTEGSDAEAGCSSWPGGGGGDADQNFAQDQMGTNNEDTENHRMPVWNVEPIPIVEPVPIVTLFTCRFPGCEKKYKHRNSMLNHEVAVHNRKPNWSWS